MIMTGRFTVKLDLQTLRTSPNHSFPFELIMANVFNEVNRHHPPRPSWSSSGGTKASCSTKVLSTFSAPSSSFPLDSPCFRALQFIGDDHIID